MYVRWIEFDGLAVLFNGFTEVFISVVLIADLFEFVCLFGCLLLVHHRVSFLLNSVFYEFLYGFSTIFVHDLL